MFEQELDFDPIGPGTSAWEAYEKACLAWQEYKGARLTCKSKESKRYNNQRQYMIEKLHENGADEATIEKWKTAIERDRNCMVFA